MKSNTEIARASVTAMGGLPLNREQRRAVKRKKPAPSLSKAAKRQAVES